MTVGELKKQIKNIPDRYIVCLPIDSEGNGYNGVCDIDWGKLEGASTKGVLILNPDDTYAESFEEVVERKCLPQEE